MVLEVFEIATVEVGLTMNMGHMSILSSLSTARAFALVSASVPLFIIFRSLSIELEPDEDTFQPDVLPFPEELRVSRCRIGAGVTKVPLPDRSLYDVGEDLHALPVEHRFIVAK